MGEMMRPEAVVLPESALVPDHHVVTPAPNQFTHEVVSPQPYWFDETGKPAEAAGVFPAGTAVVLLRHDGGRLCWVVDGRGVYVAVEHGALRRRE